MASKKLHLKTQLLSNLHYLVFSFRRNSPTDQCTLATHACHRLKFDSILKKYDIDFMAVDELGTDSGPRNLEKLEVLTRFVVFLV